jgi:hypothetical protein
MSCALAVTVTPAFGATSAGPTAVEVSSRRSGLSTRFQKVQFQPAFASRGRVICVKWPPKKMSPRAPFTIAW